MSGILKACETCEFHNDGTCDGAESIGDIGYTEDECDSDGNPPCWESSGDISEEEYEEEDNDDDDDDDT